MVDERIKKLADNIGNAKRIGNLERGDCVFTREIKIKKASICSLFCLYDRTGILLHITE